MLDAIIARAAGSADAPRVDMHTLIPVTRRLLRGDWRFDTRGKVKTTATIGGAWRSPRQPLSKSCRVFIHLPLFSGLTRRVAFDHVDPTYDLLFQVVSAKHSAVHRRPGEPMSLGGCHVLSRVQDLLLKHDIAVIRAVPQIS
jgi:hypothetical protein